MVIHYMYLLPVSHGLMAFLLNLTSTFNSFPFINYLVDPVVLGRYITYVPPVVNGIAYVDVCEVEVVGKC